MNTKTCLGVIVILIVIHLNLSCKKDISCEGCNENNKPPISIAGPDQVITLPADSVALDGFASKDPDGTISEWLWKKISGPVSFTIINPTAPGTIVKNLITGAYFFELKVTDDKGLLAKDTIQVMVNDGVQANRPPVAKAGIDQTVVLPVNTVNLDGSNSTDPDNDITAYVWTKISGPSSFSLSNANAVQTQVNNLSQGIYQFELKVTDATGFFSTDTNQVAVLDQLPACPGCRIVFVSNRDGNAEIYSCKEDGSTIQRLTYNTGTDDQPAWSPDGSRIAFISDRTGNSELYIMNADGSGITRKTFSTGYNENPRWSPDGAKIVYATLNNGSNNIWVLDVTSGVSSMLLEKPGWDGQPVWSPDGTKIVLVSDWAAYDFVYDIYIMNADGTGFTALTGDMFDHLNYLYPDWSPQGTRLALAISEEIGIDQYNTRIGVMNPDGTGLTEIRTGAAAWTRTSWSGDGNRIAYTAMVGSRKDVSWVSADGSSWGTIVTNAWNADWKH